MWLDNLKIQTKTTKKQTGHCQRGRSFGEDEMGEGD